MSKARLPNLFGIRALFISTFPPEKKKKKRNILHGNWRKWSLYMSLARQGQADPGPSMQCSIFNKQTLSISSQRVLWPCWIFNAEDGQRDRDTFPNRVGDRWKKEWEGRRKRKCFLHVPSLQPNLSKPNSNMVAQWMILSSLVRCLCWKKVFGVFVKCPSLPQKKTIALWQS